MKNFLLTIVLLAFGVISCSSCAKKPQLFDPPAPIPVASAPTVAPPVAPPPPADTVVVTFSNMTVTFPTVGWEKMDSEATMAAYLNPIVKNITIIGKETFTGTASEYTLKAIRATKDAGATLLSTKQVTLNGHKFTLLESSKVNVQVWEWTTSEAGFGYALTCGGPSGASPHDLCFSLADTLKLN